MWALALRTGATEAEILAAYDRGEIVRTHVLRPTWHLVAAADLVPLQALTAGRVRALLRAVDPKVGIGLPEIARARDVLVRSLRGTAKTRTELAAELKKAKLPATGVPLVHLLMHAELDAVICSGPRRGRHGTYALVDERIAPVPARSRDVLLADLATRYFTTRGPAQEKDFGWWSHLVVRDARRAIELAGLRRVEHAGAVYFAGKAPSPSALRAGSNAVRFLPSYDELVVAYRDRSALLPDPTAAARLDERSFVVGRSLVVRGGIVVGAWRRTLGKTEVAIDVDLLDAPSADERAALVTEAERYASFVGLRAKCRFAVAKKSFRARA